MQLLYFIFHMKKCLKLSCYIQKQKLKTFNNFVFGLVSSMWAEGPLAYTNINYWFTIYFFKINKGDTRTMCEIFSKLWIHTVRNVVFLYPLPTSENLWLFDIFKRCKKDHDAVLVSILLTLDKFHTLFWRFHCGLWTSKWRSGKK